MHTQGILLRSLTLDDVLITSDGGIKLIDFFYSKELENSMSELSNKSMVTSIFPPESQEKNIYNFKSVKIFYIFLGLLYIRNIFLQNYFRITTL